MTATKARLPAIPLEAMTPAQKAVADAIMAGPRGGLRGPFNAWLHSPEFADRMQKVGEYIRFRSSLGPRLNEMAILMTAAHCSAPYEWYAHHPLAMKAGLQADIAEAIAAGRRPEHMREDEAIVYDACRQLHTHRMLDDAVYARAVAAFGEQGVVELIGVTGYYTIVAMTLNVAQVLPPEDAKVPVKAPAG